MGLLSELYDAPVETAEVDPSVSPVDELLPEEAALLERAAPSRRLEFRAGRHCARLALSRLGSAGPVLRASDRSPIWPEGIVGSIAHTRTEGRAFCGAAAARADAVSALGLDVEIDAPLETKLWRRILRPAEEVWILAQPEPDRGFWAMLVFSAKEAVYKCQYPLSRQFLEFSDVELGAKPGQREFSAKLLRAAPPYETGHEFVGRYTRKSGIIASGVALRARAAELVGGVR